MRTSKLLTALALAGVVLIAGCSKDEYTPASIKESSRKSSVQETGILGSAASFAVLANTTVTSAGTTVIIGDLGVSPGTAITGFKPEPFNTIEGPGTVTSDEPGIVIGTIYAGGDVANEAHIDAVKAYNYLLSLDITTQMPAIVNELGGLTLTPGVYNFPISANLALGETLTLDFQGNNDALFVFQITSTLVTFLDSKIVAIGNDDQTCLGSNVYWVVGSSATINGAEFIGTVLANTTITMTTAANVAPLDDPADTINVYGRMLALGGAVTMVNENIVTCGSSDGGTIPPLPKPCRDFVTGGGWIDGKATFGVSGGIKNDRFWGQLSYNDHSGVKVKSSKVTSYMVIDEVTRQIEGIARLNGKTTVTYKVIVVDNGEPGRNDSFSLELSNGYTASGNLKGGNIQLHKNCDGKKDKDDREKYNDRDERYGHDSCDKDNGDKDWNKGRDNDRHGDKDDDRDGHKGGHRN